MSNGEAIKSAAADLIATAGADMGSQKVFISRVWAFAFASQCTLAEFRAIVADAQEEGLRLSRLDLVEYFDGSEKQAEIAKSETRRGVAAFHFVNVAA